MAFDLIFNIIGLFFDVLGFTNPFDVPKIKPSTGKTDDVWFIDNVTIKGVPALKLSIENHGMHPFFLDVLGLLVEAKDRVKFCIPVKIFTDAEENFLESDDKHFEYITLEYIADSLASLELNHVKRITVLLITRTNKRSIKRLNRELLQFILAAKPSAPE